jgi:hypothetical protein
MVEVGQAGRCLLHFPLSTLVLPVLSGWLYAASLADCCPAREMPADLLEKRMPPMLPAVIGSGLSLALETRANAV